VDSKVLLIPVLTAILGSSIISTISTNSYNEFINSIKQPNFKISSYYEYIADPNTNDTNEATQQQFSDNPFLQQPDKITPSKKSIQLTIEITNTGNKIATNPEITFDLTDSILEIVDYNAPRKLETTNMDREDISPIIYLNLSKINIGETIPVNIVFKSNTDESDYSFNSLRYYELGYGAKYIDKIAINHEQGVKIYPNEQSRINAILNIIMNAIYPILIIFTTFFIFYIYNKYKSNVTFVNSKNNVYTISKLKNLLSKINNEIRNDISSLKIYDFKFWMKINNEIKSKLFDNYEDFNIVNQLFIFLRHREYECLKEKIDNNKVLDYNRKCYEFAQKALEQIDWIKLILYNVNSYSTTTLFFRFSIYSLVISGLESLLLVIYGLVNTSIYISEPSYQTSSSLYYFMIVLLISIFILRIIAYYYILKRMVKQIITKSIYRDYKIPIFRGRGLFILIGLSSFFVSGILITALGALSPLQGSLFYNENPFYRFVLLLPYMFIIDIIRISTLSIYILKNKILIESNIIKFPKR